MFVRLGAALLAASCLSAPASAQADLAAKFGARETIQQISVSPDGERIVFIQPSGDRGAVALVADLAKGEVKPILRSSGSPERLTSCHWASNTRLICNVYFIENLDQRVGFTRLVSVNADGSDMKQLSARTNSRSLGVAYSGGRIIDWGPEGSLGSVLMTRTFVPENQTGTHLASSSEGLGVELVDASNLRRRTIEQARLNAAEYISDGSGTVRVMGIQAARAAGYLGDTIDYSYRLPGKRDWNPLSKLRFEPSGTVSGFNPYAVDRASNLLYGFDNYQGRNALFSIALDDTKKTSLVFAHPQVDVDGLVRIGRQQRVVGASYATDKRQTEFFDPELRRLREALGKALPGKPMVTFVDGTADEKKLLMFAGGDSDPGTYYVYDKASRKLEEVMPARPQLASVKLASVRPIEYPAADGTRIPGYLTVPAGSDGKNLPAIVMPHGGPGARDEWGFDWLAQFFAARGFAVLQPNFRGSTGYGDAWFQKNGFQSWKTAIGDVNDAGRWLVQQGIAKPGKLAILGWSYGGYAALQSSVLDPDLFKAVVAIAPVTDLDALREESRNYTNFKLVDAFIGHGDHIRAGSPARNAERIKAPVLLFHGDQDMNVEIGESRLMARKLRDAGAKVELVEFTGLDHQLNDDKARATLLDRSDQFLRGALGIAP